MKTSGSYPPLVRGVSQQTPDQRYPGQLAEQVNMIPDPVQGPSRRWGSQWVAEQLTALAAGDVEDSTMDTDSWRSFRYSNNGNDFVVLYRTAAAVGDLPPVIVFNRTTGQFLNYSRNTVDAALDLLESGGCSAITSVGKYVFMAGNSIVPGSTSNDLWGDISNQLDAVLWIRGGAYARKFSATVTKSDNTQVSFEYTTPASSYPGTLDTSAVPLYAADPGGGTSVDTEAAYIKQVGADVKAELTWWPWAPTSLSVKKGTTTLTNTAPTAPANSSQYSYVNGDRFVVFHSSNLAAVDVTVTYTHTKTVTNPAYAQIVSQLTNAYQSAVTNWIGTAAAAIQPAAIAEQLRLAAVAAGLTTATRQASTVIFDNVKGIVVSDGGDGTLVRGVANEVSSIEEVSDLHKIGKIVKVRARNAEDAFYLKAESQDPNVTSGYTEVTWVEGAGVQHFLNTAFIYATADGTNFHVASSASLMDALVTGPAPTYVASTCGDAVSSPLPFFVGKKITYLGVFQDRLLVGAGAVLRASKIGDYLNFFRSSLLTAPADDPLETLSQGSEDDELRSSVLYDRDLILFGRDRQYAISGRVAFTPTAPNMPVMSSHENAAEVPPIAAGGLIFYAKPGPTDAAVFQIQIGQVAESPESFPASSQLDTYLSGRPIELKHMATPSTVFLRTTGRRDSVYAFSYFDTQQGRQQDAWHRWDFNAALGPVIGMEPTSSGLLVFTLRTSGSSVYIVADLCPMSTGVSTYPYLDSVRDYADVVAETGSLLPDSTGPWYVAFNNESTRKFLGTALEGVEDLQDAFPSTPGLMAGALQTSYLIPTNPFVRDAQEQAIVDGVLSISAVTGSFAKTSGFVSEVSPVMQTVVAPETITTEFNGFVVGDASTSIGQIPVTDFKAAIPIGVDTNSYVLKISARDWYPFNIKALSWVGQWFNRTRRF